MANSHVQPSMMAEVQSNFGDLLAPALLASNLTTPGAGMTLPAFATYGYVRNGTPTRLCYVNQPAAAVTLSGSAGVYWLALMHDTHSAVAGWTRQAGTHYCWQASATQPADPPGGLVMASVTVTGANISAVDVSVNYPYTKIAYGGTNGQLAFSSALTWNGATLKTTGEIDVTASAALRSGVYVPDRAGDNLIGLLSQVATGGGANRWSVYTDSAPAHFGGNLETSGTFYAGGATTLQTTLAVYGNTSLLNRVGIAYPPDAGYWLRSGSAYIDSILTAAITNTGALQVNGQSTLTGSVGIWRAPDAAYALVTNGQVYVGGALTVSGGTGYFSSYVGIETAPNGGYSLILGRGLYSYGTAYFVGQIATGDPATTRANLGIGNVGTQNAPLSIAYGGTGAGDAGTARVNLGLQSMATQPHTGVQITGGTVDGLGSFSAGAAPAAGFIGTFGGSVHVSNLLGVRTTIPTYPVDVAGGLRASSIASGLFTPGQWNYDLGGNSVYAHDGLGVGVGATARTHQLQITGGAGRPGGGPWSDTSYRAMKRAIAPISDALSVLLSQQGRQYEWEEETRAALLPGVRYGFIEDEVTLPQWREATLDGGVAIAANGFEALAVEAFRALERRIRSLEGYDK